MVKSIVMCGAVLLLALPVLADIPSDANNAAKSSVTKGTTHKAGRKMNSDIHGLSYPVKAPVDSSTGRVSGQRKHIVVPVQPPK